MGTWVARELAKLSKTIVNPEQLPGIVLLKMGGEEGLLKLCTVAIGMTFEQWKLTDNLAGPFSLREDPQDDGTYSIIAAPLQPLKDHPEAKEWCGLFVPLSVSLETVRCNQEALWGSHVTIEPTIASISAHHNVNIGTGK